MIHDIVATLDRKDTSITKVLFLDFSSAFNTVLPNQLISDLQAFVKDTHIMHWLGDYMKGWSRQIKHSKGLSEKSNIDVGVPQGGPLSALLFTIYTDEIRSNGNCSVIKYADDTAIVGSISKKSCTEDLITYESFINHTTNTCNHKNLLLNPKKSKEIVFENINIKHKGLNESKLKKTIVNGQEVERTEHTMYLGVSIDFKLNFSSHVSKILQKVYYIVSSLSFIVPYFALDVRMNVFNIYVLPQILYAVPVWYHFILQKDQKRLKTLLKYCAKILRLDQTTLINEINNSAKKEFERAANAILTKDNHPLHSSLNSLLQSTSYNLRKRSITPKFRTERFRNSFVYRAALFIQGNPLQNLL